jgi:hypothetical protein
MLFVFEVKDRRVYFVLCGATAGAVFRLAFFKVIRLFIKDGIRRWKFSFD